MVSVQVMTKQGSNVYSGVLIGDDHQYKVSDNSEAFTIMSGYGHLLMAISKETGEVSTFFEGKTTFGGFDSYCHNSQGNKVMINDWQSVTVKKDIGEERYCVTLH